MMNNILKTDETHPLQPHVRPQDEHAAEEVTFEGHLILPYPPPTETSDAVTDFYHRMKREFDEHPQLTREEHTELQERQIVDTRRHLDAEIAKFDGKAPNTLTAEEREALALLIKHLEGNIQFFARLGSKAKTAFTQAEGGWYAGHFSTELKRLKELLNNP